MANLRQQQTNELKTMITNEIRDIVAELRAGIERGEFEGAPTGEKYLGRALGELECLLATRRGGIWGWVRGLFN